MNYDRARQPHRETHAFVFVRQPNFPELIKKLEEAGHSRAAVARGIGRDRSTISRIANDHRQPLYDTGNALLVFASRVLPPGNND